MPAAASVVVIGGGVIGASIAFHLAEAGVGDVLLVERGQLAGGSTSRAAGGVRAQFSDPLNIQIGARSLRAFADFGRRPGWEIGFHQVGYLFLLTREADVRSFEASVELQGELGVPSRMLSAADAARLNPLIQVGDVLAAAFSPDDGHATPEAVVQGYAGGARALGAQLETGCEVTAIEEAGNGDQVVVTSQGRVRAGAVVCAAGAWSARVGEMAGVALPVEPLRRQVLFTEPVPGLDGAIPMTIDFETSFYFHREGPGLLLGMSYADEQPGFDDRATDDWIPALMEIAGRRAPAVAEAGIAGGWAGLYEVTPDHNALIGEAAGGGRFLYATGFSGHGFLQAPAVGEIVRDLYLGREPFVDVSPLAADRFSADHLRPERNII
ncbi:MAG: NAD(P)/FAD-dependent oxidoreductase [Gaiellales bacterium]